MEKEHDSAFLMHPRGIGLLLGGLFVAPLAWALHLGLAYAMVSWVCETGNVVVFHLLTLFCLALGGAGLYMAWHSGRIAGPGWPDDAAGPKPRSRFLAVGGLIMSMFFILVIVAQWIPMLLLDPCTTV